MGIPRCDLFGGKGGGGEGRRGGQGRGPSKQAILLNHISLLYRTPTNAVDRRKLEFFFFNILMFKQNANSLDFLNH